MYFPQVLMTFATTAAAIDITFYSGRGCGGIAVKCPRVNPDICCTVNFPTSFNSIGWNYVPTNWHIEARGYDQRPCVNQRLRSSIQGRDNACYDQGGWSWQGANYGFVNKKRALISQGGKTAQDSPCEQASVLTLLDGADYNISGLAEEPLVELV
ncbi:hypothetical protein PG995_004668 [Apiospora arundinis]